MASICIDDQTLDNGTVLYISARLISVPGYHMSSRLVPGFAEPGWSEELRAGQAINDDGNTAAWEGVLQEMDGYETSSRESQSKCDDITGTQNSITMDVD